MTGVTAESEIRHKQVKHRGCGAKRVVNESFEAIRGLHRPLTIGLLQTKRQTISTDCE